MALQALAGIHQPPAIVHRQRGGNFDESVFAVVHGAQTHGHMPGPGRGDIDRVNVVARHHLFPDVFIAAVNDRAFAGFFFALVGRRFGTAVHNVADGDDVSEINAETVAYMRHPTVQADDRHAHAVHRLRGEVVNRLLARRPRTRAAVVGA